LYTHTHTTHPHPETNNEVSSEMEAQGEGGAYAHINTIQPLVCTSLDSLQLLNTLTCEGAGGWGREGLAEAEVTRLCC
jgi:hypothetical protein